MFREMLLKCAESEKTCQNQLSDGKYRCTYRELPEIFAALDVFFTELKIPGDEGLVLVIGNTLPEAVLLLWMLYKKRDVLLQPRGGLVQNLPEFFRDKAVVEVGAPGLELKKPGTYLKIEANPDFKEETPRPGSGGSIFLKTSGSTAEPKLVLHAHDKFVRNAHHCVERFGLTPGDNVFIPVPIYHMYGLGAGFIPSVLAGASITLLERTNIITYLDREKQNKPNVSYLTPVLCDMFLQARKSPYRYRLVVTAGDRITPTTFRDFEARYGKLVNLYGSTELGAIATTRKEDPLDLRSHGILETMPGVTVDFVRENPGTSAANDFISAAAGNGNGNGNGRVWEILCTHENGFEVYVDNKGKEITTETARPFRTKDLGKRITPNRFQVVGRIGNSMNRNGILVAFLEVESLMEQGIPGVAHVVVTAGEGCSARGKKMIAWCEIKPREELSEKEIRHRCFEIMLRHMVPDQVRIIAEIPRLPNGKFDRVKLTGELLKHTPPLRGTPLERGKM